MNINYHYYTIKTLAHHAGFDDEKAQLIAHFSQRVDDYIMFSPFIVKEKPPNFFIDIGLAEKIKNRDMWAFMPCPTGVNVLASIHKKYRLYTVMPFHFITQSPYHKLPKNCNRSHYRCVAAENPNEKLLINRLIKETADRVKANINDNTSLMALGMVLHTFADTYAHEKFSGFKGWENKYRISNMKHKSSTQGLSKQKINFYSVLPSIGHANVFHVPDYCDCKIELFGKEKENSKMELMVDRDNSVFFSDCSKRILNILCGITGKSLNNNEWNTLQKKLLEVYSFSKEPNLEKWEKTFKDTKGGNISYNYNKKDYFKLEFKLLHWNKNELKNKLKHIYQHEDIKDICQYQESKVAENELTNMDSVDGDILRDDCITYVDKPTKMFYDYNELAYLHVHNVTNEYRSNSLKELRVFIKNATNVL